MANKKSLISTETAGLNVRPFLFYGINPAMCYGVSMTSLVSVLFSEA